VSSQRIRGCLTRKLSSKETEETLLAFTRGERNQRDCPRACCGGREGVEWCSGGTEVYHKAGTSFGSPSKRPRGVHDSPGFF